MNPPDFLLQDEKGALHGYYDPAILRIHLHEKGSQGIRVFSRDHRVLTLKYTEAGCLECFDHETRDPCVECCPHDEHDHGICLDCGEDRSEELAGDAESMYEGDR